MQEELQFLHKPELEYEKLSNVADYFDRLMLFNDKYGMDLQYTPKARWKPGTYDKIKKKYVEIEHPQWTRKRGANNLRKLFEHNDWSARNFRDSLHKLDDMMSIYRNNGQLLVDGDTLEQGKRLLDDVYESLRINIPDVNVQVTPFAFWNRHYYDENGSIPYNPILIDENKLGFSLDGETLPKELFTETDTPAWLSTNPMDWWINITFKLNDVNLRLYLDGRQGENPENLIHTQPYGEIMLGLSIPLYDYCLGRRAAYANAKMSRWQRKITMMAYQQPLIEGLRHPYIYRDDTEHNNKQDSIRRQSRAYGLGNICLGDWNDDILKQIFYGNLGIAKALLRTWSEVYYIHGTGPLNTLHLSFAGNNMDWSELVQSSIGISATSCQTLIKRGYDEASLLENHCNNCTLARDNQCDMYRNMTYVPREITGEFGEWAVNQAAEYKTMKIAVGLRTMFTRLYNTKGLSVECTLQHAIFNDRGRSYPECRGHLRTSYLDSTFQDMFINMKSDGYEFNKVQLDTILKVMERIFYDYRFRQAYHYYGGSGNVYSHWVESHGAQSGIIQAESEYPIDELQSTIHQMEYTGGVSELMADGMFKKTSENDFITYLKNMGEIENE